MIEGEATTSSSLAPSLMAITTQYCQVLYVIQQTLVETVKRCQMLQGKWIDLQVKYYCIFSNQEDTVRPTVSLKTKLQ